ncbi:hypothetical protein ACH47C_16110 [Streptomyces rishiriensis]
MSILLALALALVVVALVGVVVRFILGPRPAHAPADVSHLRNFLRSPHH